MGYFLKFILKGLLVVGDLYLVIKGVDSAKVYKYQGDGVFQDPKTGYNYDLKTTDKCYKIKDTDENTNKFKSA